MRTEVLSIDPRQPDSDLLLRAGTALRQGRLVAFPTETVYGLGANALDGAAVARIFAAKGRPATNPVIVHVASVEQAITIAASWPQTAQKLAERFWPGPLTLVLKKRPEVPDIVTAGGDTVAIRSPAHPVALGLIRAAGVPIAAPSANLSTRISPTRAEHVLRGLDGRIDLLLDGGPTSGGLESTVLDLTVAPPRLLRPGLLWPRDIVAVIGPFSVATPRQSPTGERSAEPARSPGMLQRHYAPTVPMECVADSGRRVDELCQSGMRVGWLTHLHADVQPSGRFFTIELPDDPADYASQLYAALHTLEAMRLDRIVVELPPEAEAWHAIRDRLRRAATPNGAMDG